MGTLHELPSGQRNLTCVCGSSWFTTQIVMDAVTHEVVGYSVSNASCSECGRGLPKRGA